MFNKKPHLSHLHIWDLTFLKSEEKGFSFGKKNSDPMQIEWSFSFFFFFGKSIRIEISIYEDYK